MTANFLAICTWLCFPSVNIIMAAMITLPKPLSKLATTMTLKDGRKLAYEVRGSLDRKHKVFWNHGIISSRYLFLCGSDKALPGGKRQCQPVGSSCTCTACIQLLCTQFRPPARMRQV